MKRLPETFLYGATVSAHQVEGNDFSSDWWRWEQRASRIRDGSTSALGAGHFERYAEDFALARKLGHNAVCLSFSWPRIHPEPDVFDSNALCHYRAVLDSAQSQGLTPLCVLHQVTVPAWFIDCGGWCAPDAASHFEDYVHRVVDCLGAACRLWLPVYEPEHWLTLACREGCWPGARAGRRAYRQALAQLAHAHVMAARVLREHDAAHQVGISIRGAVVEPYDPHSPWDLRAARQEQHRLNMRYLEAVHESSPQDDLTDFIGLSYGGGFQVRFAPLYLRGGCALPVDRSGRPASIDDGQAHLSGFEEILTWFAMLNKPMYLSGLDMNAPDEATRCRMLSEHTETLIRLMGAYEGGMDVRAWFHASLLDGFEWHHGYTRRRGLIHVKQPGLERTPNECAWLFQDIARHGQVRPGSLRRFTGA